MRSSPIDLATIDLATIDLATIDLATIDLDRDLPGALFYFVIRAVSLCRFPQLVKDKSVNSACYKGSITINQAISAPLTFR